MTIVKSGSLISSLVLMIFVSRLALAQELSTPAPERLSPNVETVAKSADDDSNEGEIVFDDVDTPNGEVSLKTEHAEGLASRISWNAQVGTGMSFEKNSDGRTDDLRLPLQVGLGLEYSGLIVGTLGAKLEYSRYQTADGNPTVTVRREDETLLMWLDRLPSSERTGRGVVPALGLGFGASRTSVESRLNGATGVVTASTERSTGIWKPMIGVSAGFAFQWSKELRLRTEVRWQSPWANGGIEDSLTRFGLSLALQYRFL